MLCVYMHTTEQRAEDSLLPCLKRVSLLFTSVYIRSVNWSLSFWEDMSLLCLALCGFWEFQFTFEASVLSLQAHILIFKQERKVHVCVDTKRVCVCV